MISQAVTAVELSAEQVCTSTPLLFFVFRLSVEEAKTRLSLKKLKQRKVSTSTQREFY
jgi:hypothetical protein